ncbi:hypothetical protein [Profundibacter amoris]|uniref:Uncharacterized protein n=1 Tax=Profundibacter amoris TaxID=2171755 RepID=A0A347UF21_9RHOB|nr:hypothetical protein [Profundibacter amoris]AXX97449.1 hypothetical protein BAR1_05565 [Profundibacter amoris]
MPQRKTRVIAAGLVIGLSGLLMITIFIISTCGRSIGSCFANGAEIILPAMIGAGLAGMMFYALFGGKGQRGWMLAAVGAILATAVGAMLAVLVLGVWSGEDILNDASVVLVGPWFILVMFDQFPLTIFLWIGIMIAAHLVLRWYFINDTEL